MIEILKVVKKVKFITLKGPREAWEQGIREKNLPVWPGSLTHFKPTRGSMWIILK